MKSWPVVPLANICAAAIRYETPTAGEIYRQLGVRLWGVGAYEREQIDGADTKYSNFNRIEAGDLVVNKIWARNGAIAVATDELAGTYVSTEFPTYTLDRSRIDSQWMRLITKWRGFWSACDDKARGTSGKNRIKPQQFLAIGIPLPSLADQQTIIARLHALAEKTRQLEAHLDAVERDAEHLLALRFRDAIANTPLRPMAEVAPVIRRSVDIDISTRYREVGARSFGKGLFVKPEFDGAEATWQKPVWIATGDLVFSNIKAWEGAIAVAGDQHEGCIASHRYITCLPDCRLASAEFLRYYFLAEEGIEKIGFASPGTADRNRTLSVINLGKIKVPVPSLAIQKTFDRLQADIAALKTKHTAIREANAALLPATLERVFSEPT
jgi:type I restriction enzyme S subunit